MCKEGDDQFVVSSFSSVVFCTFIDRPRIDDDFYVCLFLFLFIVGWLVLYLYDIVFIFGDM